MIEADVVISWFSSGAAATSAFARPVRMIQLPTPAGQKYQAQIASFGQTPLLNILKKYAPDVRPLRVAVLGFSEGCQGARELLRSPDGGRVDSAIAIDGIHAQYQPGSTTRIVPAYLTAWAAMARRATEGRTLQVITASSIRPPGFASTTETADWIWRYATGSDADVQTEPPAADIVAPLVPPLVLPAGGANGIHWAQTIYDEPPISRYRRDRGLVIVNYSDLDRTGTQDHIFQAKSVLPVMVATYLADRWNRIDPRGGICVLAAPDMIEAPGGAGCFPPSALSDLYLTGQADPIPLDIPADVDVDTTLPGTTEPGDGTVTPPPPTPLWITAAKWAATVAAGSLIVEATRLLWNKGRSS